MLRQVSYQSSLFQIFETKIVPILLDMDMKELCNKNRCILRQLCKRLKFCIDYAKNNELNVDPLTCVIHTLILYNPCIICLTRVRGQKEVWTTFLQFASFISRTRYCYIVTCDTSEKDAFQHSPGLIEGKHNDLDYDDNSILFLPYQNLRRLRHVSKLKNHKGTMILYMLDTLAQKIHWNKWGPRKVRFISL